MGVERERAGAVHDEVRDLVAGQSGEAPCGQGDSVQRADAAHAVMVGEERRQVREAAAVARVDDENQPEHEDGQRYVPVAVPDAAGHHDQRGEYNRKHENQLVDGVPVFHLVAPGGEAEPPARVEYGGDGGDDARRRDEADALHD